MKVICIKHPTWRGSDQKLYLEKVNTALQMNPDVLIGPDYSLCSFEGVDKIDFNSIESSMADLAKLSQEHSSTLILPGTAVVSREKGFAGLCSFAFLGGKEIGRFFKQSDRGERKLLRANGLEYSPGRREDNHFVYDGKRIDVEICSDSSYPKISSETFMEVIQAQEFVPSPLNYRPKDIPRTHFYPRSGLNDSHRHYVFISDGGLGVSVQGILFDPKSKINRGCTDLEGVKFDRKGLKGSMTQYDIGNSNEK